MAPKGKDASSGGGTTTNPSNGSSTPSVDVVDGAVWTGRWVEGVLGHAVISFVAGVEIRIMICPTVTGIQRSEILHKKGVDYCDWFYDLMGKLLVAAYKKKSNKPTDPFTAIPNHNPLRVNK